MRKRFFAGVVAGVFFFQVSAAPVAEASTLWTERRSAIERRKGGFPLSAEAYQTLASLPQVGPGGFGSFQPVPVGTGLPPVLGGLPSYGGLPSKVLAYGSIREAYTSPIPNAPLVIHIQDAHGVEEAQKNTAAIIETLSSPQSTLSLLVALEGAVGGVNLHPYRNWPDPTGVRKVAESCMRQGQIGGPEFAGMTMQKPPSLWGVENAELYIQNVQSLREANSHKPTLDKILVNINTKTDALKDTLYSPELKNFDRHLLAWQNQSESLAEFVRALFTLGGLSSASPTYPNLSMLQNALNVEKTLDFKQVENERKALVDNLVARLSKLQLERLVDYSLQHRSGQVAYGDYYRFLIALCREKEIHFGARLERYVDYVLLAEKIDRNLLLDELALAEEDAQNRLAKTAEQKRLVTLSRRLALVQKLITQTMTPVEWSRYDRDRKNIVTIADDSGSPLAPLLSPSENFCRSAIARNVAFIDNLSTHMREQKATTAVLVAGGFHTDGLTRLLREKGLSYMVVTPKITEVPKDTHYLDVFTRDPIPLEKMFNGEKYSSDTPCFWRH